MSNLLTRVRSGCKWVAENSGWVRIDYGRVPEYAASLPLSETAAPQLDPACHYLGRGEETVAFIITLDSINFGSGYFPFLRKRPGMSGYFTVAASLNDCFKERGAWTAKQLAALSADDCMTIFGQDPHNKPIRELMQLFATALNDLGHYLEDRFEGSFLRLVQEAEGSAERLVGLLREMRFFDDEQTYRGTRVPFYKRAQLTAADLALAFERQGPGRFEDLHKLTIFADNLVPHVLRLDGVLLYDDGLAARIDRAELIEQGSEEEIEIRACALQAVELIVEALGSSGQSVTAMELDYLLWNRGQRPEYKTTKPRHRTRTVFY